VRSACAWSCCSCACLGTLRAQEHKFNSTQGRSSQIMSLSFATAACSQLRCCHLDICALVSDIYAPAAIMEATSAAIGPTDVKSSQGHICVKKCFTLAFTAASLAICQLGKFETLTALKGTCRVAMAAVVTPTPPPLPHNLHSFVQEGASLLPPREELCGCVICEHTLTKRLQATTCSTTRTQACCAMQPGRYCCWVQLLRTRTALPARRVQLLPAAHTSTPLYYV
jgi:hypothetical protein